MFPSVALKVPLSLLNTDEVNRKKMFKLYTQFQSPVE